MALFADDVLLGCGLTFLQMCEGFTIAFAKVSVFFSQLSEAQLFT
jgi:hypothetical protein